MRAGPPRRTGTKSAAGAKTYAPNPNPISQHNFNLIAALSPIPTLISPQVCFPYAGGTSMTYRNWKCRKTETWAIELPGRIRQVDF